jgi:peptidase M28-like protein/PDZ domain-containing protein
MIRRPAALLLACVLLLTSTAAVGRAGVVPPTGPELRAIVEALTAPEMDGRRAGTPGGDRATSRIADWLAAAGLRPGGDGGSFLQSFTLASGRRLGPASTLQVGGRTLKAGVDWMPHGGAREGEVSGALAFVDDTWSGELRDKVVIAPPRGSRLESLILARQRGAAALLLIADALPALDATSAPVSLASGAITRGAADALRAAPAATARLVVDLVPADVRAANVVGVLPGTDPTVAAETIVLGAHWDHLGSSGGATYYGADDNASGTAVVVGLARAFAAAGPARRTLVFVLFGAEELGLIGSGHYVRRAARPPTQTVAMLNFDMVGRMRDGKLTIGGVDSGDRLRAATADAARAAGVQADLQGSPFSPSDHSRFYSAGAPVLFFHTGGHDDYHRPGDTVDRLNVDGMARVAAVGAAVVTTLDDGARPVYARLTAPTRKRGGMGRADGAFLGVGGDAQAGDGARLAHIVAGSAAERAGLRDGDVLVRIDDVAVDGFEALRTAIRARRPGDIVRLMYLRDGRDYETSATLERSQE